jgi:GH25 family lysozyme M1 (1,4-beta-N-acetylmuramidase)
MSEPHGVDLASFQGPPVDWREAAGSIDFAAVKITELQPDGSRYVNPDAAADWQALEALKKARIAYMFGHPGAGAVESAKFFTDEIRRLGLGDDDGIALDLEVTDGKTPAQVDAWGVSVLGALELELHRPPLLYTFLSFAAEGNCARLGGYPLWIADPSSPAGSPRVPAPWETWAIQQTSITGSIDRDVASYPDVRTMMRALGKPKPKPEPTRRIEIGGPHATKDLYRIAEQYGITEPQLIAWNPHLIKYRGTGKPVPVKTWIRV